MLSAPTECAEVSCGPPVAPSAHSVCLLAARVPAAGFSSSADCVRSGKRALQTGLTTSCRVDWLRRSMLSTKYWQVWLPLASYQAYETRGAVRFMISAETVIQPGLN